MRRAIALVTIALLGCGMTADDGSATPDVPPSAVVGGARPSAFAPATSAVTRSLTVETAGATSLGLTAFTANGRIHPHGRPTTYWFEYGTTTAYGAKTAAKPVGPRLAAYFRESWDDGLGGWAGGVTGEDLVAYGSDGVSGGFARFFEPSGFDPNHEDGIGYVHLAEYLHVGTYYQEAPNPALGGGDPDFRDARVTVNVRGNAWVPNGSELVFWMQADSVLAAQNDENWRRANWAYTGFNLTDALASGDWQKLDYRLVNDSRKWTYAGASIEQHRPNYVYWSLDEALGHVNCNFFHMLVFANLGASPSGAIDFDELEIAYRNHSLLLPSNGGRVIAAPPGSGDPARLTDGWRFGTGRTWQSAPNPRGPLEIAYAFDVPVTIEAVQIHQDPDAPSREVEVLVSSDGISWSSLASGTLPDPSDVGPNYANLLQRGLSASARFAKIRILSGYRTDRWGLGEVELFGRGAVMQPDDDWYNVNLDVIGLEPGTTYHYRLVAQQGDEIVVGADRVFGVPATRAPESLTGIASRIRDATAKVEGRINPLGLATEYFFEYGLNASYGQATEPAYGGVEITPRTVVAALTDLTVGSTYHYRLVARNETGTTFGTDAIFVAK